MAVWEKSVVQAEPAITAMEATTKSTSNTPWKTAAPQPPSEEAPPPGNSRTPGAFFHFSY